MKRTPDISGQTFGDLLCIRFKGKNERGAFLYLCRCACGNDTLAMKTDLVSGKKKSCGCGQGKRSHGLSRENGRKRPLHSVWIAMRQRCMNPGDRNFKRYGGRGIRVCPQWNEYKAFHEWAMANGYKVGLTIERINNDGNYCPDNCTWIPQSRQPRNSNGVQFLVYDGQSRTYGEWGKIYGIDRTTLKDRIKRGWNIQSALLSRAYRGNRYYGEKNSFKKGI